MHGYWVNVQRYLGKGEASTDLNEKSTTNYTEER